MPNAIERIEDALVDGDQGRKAREALAAVDVLYQCVVEITDATVPSLKQWERLREARARVEAT